MSPADTDPGLLERFPLPHTSWTRERIETALCGPETRRVRLAHPAPVYVL